MEPRQNRTELVGLVLAAGAGTRYGLPKILVPGWLDGAVRALRDGGCAKVLVVTGAARSVIPDGAVEIHCPTWKRGIGASLRSGLTAVGAGADRIVVHVVDCPDVGASVVERVVRSAAGGPVRAVFDGQPGHPVVLPIESVPELLAQLRDEDGAGPYLSGRADVQLVECGDLATGQDKDFADGPARPSTPPAVQRGA